MLATARIPAHLLIKFVFTPVCFTMSHSPPACVVCISPSNIEGGDDVVGRGSLYRETLFSPQTIHNEKILLHRIVCPIQIWAAEQRCLQNHSQKHTVCLEKQSAFLRELCFCSDDWRVTSDTEGGKRKGKPKKFTFPFCFCYGFEILLAILVFFLASIFQRTHFNFIFFLYHWLSVWVWIFNPFFLILRRYLLRSKWLGEFIVSV